MITQFIQRITEISGGNQFLTAAISAWILGVITFFCRNIPKKIMFFLKKHLTTTFTVISSNESYYLIMFWFLKKGYLNKLRRINIVNGKHGDSESTKSIGLGNHIVWFKKNPLLLKLARLESSATERDKLELAVIKIGRSHKFFDSMLEEIKRDTVKDDSKTHLFVYQGDYWDRVGEQPKRSMDSLFIPKKDKQLILDTILKFQEKETWYIKNGIPYHLGILLHGPSGTGKTSLIKAIAAELNYDIKILSATQIQYIEKAFNVGQKGKRQILVVEDIDANYSVHQRTPVKKEDSQKFLKETIGEKEEFLQDMFSFGISNILNAMDGLVSAHGRIVIFTTNYLDKLDIAFLRPGRIDLKLKLDYVNQEVFCEFMKRFFDLSLDVNKIKLKSNEVTVAYLQQKILEEKTQEYFLNEFLIAG